MEVPKPKPLPPRWVKLTSGRCEDNPEGKLRFAGEGLAKAGLEMARARRKVQGFPEETWEKRYYICNKCSSDGLRTKVYHLTHLGINEMEEPHA